MPGERDPEDRSGQLIGGRYRLIEKLGAGGFGRVWKAHDETLRIDVAVKEVWLPPAMSRRDQDERLQRAEREARNAARLRDHPNIVAVHDVVIEDGAPWTVMQLVTGRSLEEHIAASGPLSVSNATKVAQALLKALGAAHAAGIVHRDVKPANVMLTADHDVVLTDFGIAVQQADTALTATGLFVGSVEYIAPERAEGRDGQAISDLFSLGVTLYQAVEGFSPFKRETPTGSLKAILFDEATPPKKAGALAPVIMGLMEKDPARRLTVERALALIEHPEKAARTAPKSEVPPTQSASFPPPGYPAPGYQAGPGYAGAPPYAARPPYPPPYPQPMPYPVYAPYAAMAPQNRPLIGGWLYALPVPLFFVAVIGLAISDIALRWENGTATYHVASGYFGFAAYGVFFACIFMCFLRKGRRMAVRVLGYVSAAAYVLGTVLGLLRDYSFAADRQHSFLNLKVAPYGWVGVLIAALFLLLYARIEITTRRRFRSFSGR